MRIKDDVRFASQEMAMCHASMVVQSVFQHLGLEMEVTGGIEDPDKLRAGRFSYHPTGGALDYKVNHISPSERHNLLWYVKRWLGDGFDALLHGANVHLHVEYDPKD